MKKLLLTSIFSVTSYYCIAQQQIPNGDFETWGTYSQCTNLDSIGNFIAADELITNFCNGYETIIKTTDSYSGMYAVKMLPLEINPVGLIANNIRIGTDLQKPNQGIPFSSKPVKLTGYYKGLLDMYDTLGITVKLKNSSGVVAQGTFTQKSNVLVQAYTLFEINLTYNTLNTSDPDSLVIFISLGTTEIYNKLGRNTEIYLDNLMFNYNTTTSTILYNTKSPLNIYTSGNELNFSEAVANVVINDLTGSQKIIASATTKTVAINTLNSGLYIVTYTYNNNYFSKKIVIE